MGSTNLVTVAGVTQTEYELTFSSPLTVTPSTSYFFYVHTTSSQTNTLNVSYDSTDVYSDGSAYISYGASGPPSSWTVQGSDLYFKIYTQGSSTSDPHINEDPANILLDIAPDYTSQGGVVTINNSNVIATGVEVTTQFQVNSFLEGIQACLSYAPYNWYWYVDVATSILHFKPANIVADFVLIKRRHYTTLNLVRTTETIKNNVYFTGEVKHRAKPVYQYARPGLD